MNELVSIVVPAYNAEKTVEKCLSSLINQSYTNIEIIVVDDGGSDNTYDICFEMSKSDDRIVCVKSPVNKGLPAARNLGISYAKGELFAFVDSDDYVEADYVKKLKDALENNDCDLAVCSFVYRDVQGNELSRTTNYPPVMTINEAFRNMFYPSDIAFGAYAWNKMYKRSIIEKNNLSYPEQFRIFEDVVFSYEYLKCCKKVAFVQDGLYNYIKNESGLIRGKEDPKKWVIYANSFDYILEKEKDPEIYCIIASQRAVHYSTAVRALAHWDMKHTEAYKYKRRVLKNSVGGLLKDKGVAKKKKLGALLTLTFPKLAYNLWAKR